MNHQGNKFLIKKNNRKQKKTTKMVAHDMKLFHSILFMVVKQEYNICTRLLEGNL
jgi:hypothetical protein